MRREELMKVDIDTTYKITLEMTETELHDLLIDIKEVFDETQIIVGDLEKLNDQLVQALNNHKVMAR